MEVAVLRKKAEARKLHGRGIKKQQRQTTNGKSHDEALEEAAKATKNKDMIRKWYAAPSNTPKMLHRTFCSPFLHLQQHIRET